MDVLVEDVSGWWRVGLRFGLGLGMRDGWVFPAFLYAVCVESGGGH